MKKLLTGLALSGLVLLAQAGNKEDIANAMKAGQWQDAQARLEQVLTQHPENAQAHYWMAETHYRLGQYPQAKAQLDEALRLDPEHKFTNNPKALAALQNRLKSVGGPSSPAPQAQAGQGPALPQAQAPVTREAQAAANPPAKKSGTSWFTWLLIGGAIIGLAMWFTRRTVKDAKEDERKELTAQLEASLNDIRDASRAIDSRSELAIEARFAMSDRARTCEQQLVAELARIKTRDEFSATRELVAQARDVAAELRGQERPSERAARLREAQLQAEAQRAQAYGQQGYGPGYGQGYGPGHGGYPQQGPGMGGVLAGAALGAVAGMAVGSAMASDSHGASHAGGGQQGGGQGYQPFDAEPQVDVSGGSGGDWSTGSSSSNWDSGSSSSSWDSGSSSSSWSSDSSSSDIDFGGGGGDDWS